MKSRVIRGATCQKWIALRAELYTQPRATHTPFFSHSFAILRNCH